MTDKPQPEALRLAEEISNLVCSSEAAAKTIAAAADELCRLHNRIAELEAQIEALSGVQALSAAPAVPAGWRAVPVNPTPEMWKAAKSVPDPNPPYPPHYGLVWDAMLAASPTPPAEQQATTTGAALEDVYAELPEPTASIGIDDAWHEPAMRDFADRTHALRMEQAAPKAAPTLPEGWTDCTIEFGNDGPEVVAYGPKRMMNRLAKWLGKYFAQVIADAATKAAPGVGNSGFDHKTAADFLNGKTVSDEAVRNFVATSRWAHDERAALSATLLAMHGVLTSREAEIAHLKKALMEAEAAPQQEAQEPVAWLNPWRADQVTTDYDAYGERGIPLYTAPLPAPDCHHRPPCDECAALAAQGGKDALPL